VNPRIGLDAVKKRKYKVYVKILFKLIFLHYLSVGIEMSYGLDGRGSFPGRV
jgi:hypothetical protein